MGRPRAATTRWVQLHTEGSTPPAGPICRDRVAPKLTRRDPTTADTRKNSPSRALQRRFRENTRPTRPKTAYFAHFGLAGRTFSRTRRDNMATLKPTTPLLTPNKGALKPPSPLHPKNALNTPISHLQRRWRFQTRLGRHPQRRRWFQTTGPPGLEVRLRCPWAAPTPPPAKFRT